MENYKGMLVVHGDLFAFDPAREYLIEQQDTQRRQRISALMVEEGYLEAWYDTRIGTLHPIRSFSLRDAELNLLQHLCIPQVVISDGGRMPEDELLQYNKKSLARQSGYIYIDQAISDRLNGTLLTCEIDHVRYTIDPERLEIRQTERPEIKFSFAHRALFDPSEQYYDLDRKEPVALSERITEFPAGVVCLQFPAMAHLDLVGYTLACKSPATTLLSYYPMQDESHQIRMVSLAQTHYPELVRRNQIEQEKQGRPGGRKPPAVAGQATSAKKKRGQHP